IKKDAHLLSAVSSSRMTEEFFKILASGKAEPIFRSLSEFKLIEYFVPSVWAKIQTDIAYSKKLFSDLKILDALHLDVSDADIEQPGQEGSARGKQKLSVLLSFFLKSWILPENGVIEDSSEAFRTALLSARAFIQPLNPPRMELEAAILMIFRTSGLSPLQKPQKARGRRRPASRKSDSQGFEQKPHTARGGGKPGTEPDSSASPGPATPSASL
ncbi:MAG TPA: hypothetical protein VN437_06605, partial [Rectinemataceae bacterium]|nr:hypothetical protein [Rectinemataceae bacterium]